jgi:hypothetical protein
MRRRAPFLPRRWCELPGAKESAIVIASKESLAIWWLLARQAIASDLRLGVRKDGKKFVECGGTPVNDPETKLPDFSAFDAAIASLPREPQ